MSKRLRLIVLGNRKAVNGIDDALPLLGDRFGSFAFLHEGEAVGAAWSAALPQADFDLTPDLREADILYLRFDWFDSLLRSGRIFRVLQKFRYRKLVVGYHCHLCAPDPVEERLFGMADSFVLLNEASRDYFHGKYPGLRGKPVHLLRSLFLPRRDWYGEPVLVRPPAEGPVVLGLTGATNRVSGLPAEPELVPDIMSAMNRYDYLRLLRIAGRNPAVQVRIFGNFATYSAASPSRVEQLYREACLNVEVLGRVPNHAFDEALGGLHLSLLNGYLPYEGVPPFENLNYQLRYNSLIKAGVPPVVSRQTCGQHEAEMEARNFGLVLDDNRQYRHLDELARRAAERCSHADLAALVEANAFDTYAPALADFLAA